MSRILILYSTVDGHTLTLCRRLQAIAEQSGHGVIVADIENHQVFDASHYDTVVVGASIRYGHHRPTVLRYLRENRQSVKALFTVNIVARKPGKSAPDTNPYMKKLLRQIGWRPPLLAVFAGRLDYPSLGFLDRNVIRFIMLLTRGPTDPKGTFEFTDWQQVDAFGHLISAS
jgi:menaquinone-dependent protoporphyrinogen oxidase